MSIVIGGLYYTGFLVSFNLTYDRELDQNEAPGNELLQLEGYLQPVIDIVLGEYSVQALLEYTKTNNPSANKKFSIAMDFYRSQYGAIEGCPNSSPVYIEQLSIFNKAEYFWRWSSNCNFEKAIGTVVFDIKKSDNGWVLKRFGIKQL